MLWLKQKGLKNRAKYLCWYENIQSREYDQLTLKRLSQILKEYNNILKATYLNGDFNHEYTNIIELCAG